MTQVGAALIRMLATAALRPEPANQQDRSALLQAYLAEYEAITLRNTYWLTLQYALLPILGAGIAVLAQMWGQFDKDQPISTQAHRIIIWLAIVIINVVLIAHSEVGWESYNNVVYLENSLRLQIIDLLDGEAPKKDSALGYETYLRQQRGKGPKWWEVPGPIVSTALLLGGTILFGGFHRLFGWFYPWTAVEWAAVTVNAFLSYLVIKVTVKMVRRRRDIGNKVASVPTPSPSPHRTAAS